MFVMIGTFLPYINQTGNTNSIDYNINDINQELIENTNDAGEIGFWDVMASIGKMFFWTFGALPFWLDSFFLVLRIMFYVAIVDIAWIG